MTKKPPEIDEATRRIMGALVRMRPKPHDEMKLGKPRDKKPKTAKKKERAKDAKD
jgi:hypothetical protein